MESGPLHPASQISTLDAGVVKADFICDRNRPWGAQTLGPAWFWECLWGCFWMKLTLNWWTLQSEWLCPVWVGLVQPFEGLNRTNRWQKRRLLLSDCELGHQSLDLDWNIGLPGSSVCWLRCTYVCVLVLSLKNPNTDVFLCQWMRTPCILSMTSPCQLHQVCPETYLILPLAAELLTVFCCHEHPCIFIVVHV